MCKTYNTKLTKFVLSLKRPDSRLLIELLTWHCLLASHAFNIGLDGDNKFMNCKECVETVEHVICEYAEFGK